MPPKTAATPQPHMGRKIEKLRTLKGIKQSDLAKRLGIAQSALSNIEQSETVEEDKLQKIAEALELSVEAIKNFSEEAAITNIQNYSDNAVGNYPQYCNDQTYHFNPIEKLMEMVEENKRLYTALLDEKDARIRMLEGR